MGGSPVLSGALVAWEGLFSADELDALVRLGDSLALEKAELSGGGRGYENIRSTKVAWVPRQPGTEALYQRIENAVLELNARYFRFDLSGMAMFQYAVYGGPEGRSPLTFVVNPRATNSCITAWAARPTTPSAALVRIRPVPRSSGG